MIEIQIAEDLESPRTGKAKRGASTKGIRQGFASLEVVEEEEQEKPSTKGSSKKLRLKKKSSKKLVDPLKSKAKLSSRNLLKQGAMKLKDDDGKD